LTHAQKLGIVRVHELMVARVPLILFVQVWTERYRKLHEQQAPHGTKCQRGKVDAFRRVFFFSGWRCHLSKQTLVPEQKHVRFRFAALHSHEFTLLWLGGIVSYIGTQMQLIGTAWLVVQAPNAALWLGALSLCSALPTIILPPFGGILADRVNRITLLKWARSIQIALPLLVVFLLASGRLQLWMLCVHALLVGAATAFSFPANQTLLPSLVPEEDVQSATSLQSAMFTSATLVGPALGGLLLQPLGVAGLFLVDALSTLAVFIPLFLLHGISERENVKRQTPRQRTLDGIRLILQQRALLVLLGMAICINLLQGSYQVLLPLFARDQWHVGADGYGWLRAASGAGALLSSFLLSAVGNIRRKGVFILGATLLQACILILFAYMHFYIAALALIFLVGILEIVASALIQTQLYLFASEQIRSSVMALYIVALVGFNSIGAMIGGSLAQFTGCSQAVTWIVLAGMVVMIGMLLLKAIPLNIVDGRE
jgi:predicted MFS family arabinose efflux permease